MKALILAAGVGRRLGQEHPKCLLRFDGQTLLARHLDCLRRLGVDEVVMAVGHRSDMIQAELNTLEVTGFASTLHNPRYEQGSVLSLWTLREHLEQGGDVLLMDADVLYDCRLLERLIQTRLRNCFLLDRRFEPGDEPVKLCVHDGQLVEFRKQVEPHAVFDFCGESVGFFRFSGDMAARLAMQTRHYASNGLDAAPYEEAIRDLLLRSPEEFGFEETGGLPWIEIDFPADIRRAEEDILPRLRRGA